MPIVSHPLKWTSNLFLVPLKLGFLGFSLLWESYSQSNPLNSYNSPNSSKFLIYSNSSNFFNSPSYLLNFYLFYEKILKQIPTLLQL